MAALRKFSQFFLNFMCYALPAEFDTVISERPGVALRDQNMEVIFTELLS
jgi:hypothetical protein